MGDLAARAGAAYHDQERLRNLTGDLGDPIAAAFDRHDLSGPESLAVVAGLSAGLIAMSAARIEDDGEPAAFMGTALAFSRLLRAALPKFAASVESGLLYAELIPLVLNPAALAGREDRQQQVARWCAAAFGAGHASSLPQRGIRLLEEAIEAAQAAGCEREMCHRLVDHVFDRPAGELSQELGGVGVTVLALAAAAGVSAEACEAEEVARVLSKPLDHFAARNAAKNAAGFNVANGEASHG